MTTLLYQKEGTNFATVVDEAFNKSDGKFLVLSDGFVTGSKPILEHIHFFNSEGYVVAEFIPVVRTKDNAKGVYNTISKKFSFNDEPGDFMEYLEKAEIGMVGEQIVWKK